MQFLKTLFWVVLAVFLAIFASRNWHDVTLNLWGDIQADIKLPVLLLADLPDRLPADLPDHSRAALALRRRLEALERQQAPPVPAAPAADDDRRARWHEARSSSPSTRPTWTVRKRIAEAGQAPCRRAQARPGILLPPTAAPACRDWPSSACRSSSTSSCTTFPTPSPRRSRRCAPLEPAVLTVHAAGGRAMLEDAKAAAPAGTKVVAVTVLTSLDERDLAAIGVSGDAARPGRAAGRAGARRRARRHRLLGRRSAAARKRPGRTASSSFPGVRPADGDVGDQKRVMTPRQALDAGASILVIGRPITAADDPDDGAPGIAATL